MTGSATMMPAPLVSNSQLPLRIAGEAFNDEFDRARVASVRHAIP